MHITDNLIYEINLFNYLSLKAYYVHINYIRIMCTQAARRGRIRGWGNWAEIGGGKGWYELATNIEQNHRPRRTSREWKM